jgi:hypothetical protein
MTAGAVRASLYANRRLEMSQAVHEVGCKRRSAAPTAAPGSVWFGLMVAAWAVFFTLLAVSPETLADAYDWLTGLAIVWEILMWIVLLPWALAYVVWESSWAHWLQVLVVVVIATAHLGISVPRTKRNPRRGSEQTPG